MNKTCQTFVRNINDQFDILDLDHFENIQVNVLELLDVP